MHPAYLLSVDSNWATLVQRLYCTMYVGKLLMCRTDWSANMKDNYRPWSNWIDRLRPPQFLPEECGLRIFGIKKEICRANTGILADTRRSRRCTRQKEEWRWKNGKWADIPEIRVLSFIRSQGPESGIEYYHTCGKKHKQREARWEHSSWCVPWIKKDGKRRELKRKSDPWDPFHFHILREQRQREPDRKDPRWRHPAWHWQRCWFERHQSRWYHWRSR